MMKKLLYIITLVVLIYTKVLGDCPDSSILFTNQNQINAFVTSFPKCFTPKGILIDSDTINPIINLNPLLQIKGIIGDLIIKNNFNLYDLRGLDSIKFIYGNLEISNSSISSINVFNALDTIGGEIKILNNPNLLEINTFSNILVLRKEIRIINNSQLRQINGFEKLWFTYSDIIVIDNPNLEHIGTFNKLTNVNLLRLEDLTNLKALPRFENLDYLTSLFIRNCNSINNLRGLENLLISHSIYISDCDKFSSTEGLENIETLSNGITLQNLPNLIMIGNHPKAKLVSQYLVKNCQKLLEAKFNLNVDRFGGLIIQNCENLKTIQGLNHIPTLANLVLKNNPLLSYIEPLEELEAVGDLLLDSLNSISNLSFLSKLNFVAKNLTISNNYGLTSLEGLQNLKIVNSSMLIENNPFLANFDNLSGLNEVSNNLVINNSITQNLDGLSNLISVGDWLTIKNCNELLTLKGLEKVKLKIMRLNIENCVKLLDLTSFTDLTFENSTSDNAEIRINNCPSLRSLDGLESVKAHLGTLALSLNNNSQLLDINAFKEFDYRKIHSLSINNCFLLNTCNIDPICQFLADTSKHRYAKIQNNGNQCRDIQTILANCDFTSVDYISAKHSFYPNPSSGMFTIDELIDNTAISVIDSRGNLIYKTVSVGDKVDLTPLPSGVYTIIFLEDERSVIRSQVIINK